MAARNRLGIALIVVGLLGVLWGVLYVLEAANGPGAGPTSFDQRRSYNQVKTSVHRSLPVGILQATGGALLVAVGTRLRRRAAVEADGVSDPARGGHPGPP